MKIKKNDTDCHDSYIMIQAKRKLNFSLTPRHNKLISENWSSTRKRLTLNERHENTLLARKTTPITKIACKCYRIAILISDNLFHKHKKKIATVVVQNGDNLLRYKHRTNNGTFILIDASHVYSVKCLIRLYQVQLFSFDCMLFTRLFVTY